MKNFKTTLYLALLLLTSLPVVSAQHSLPRVIALSPHLVELVYAVGAGKQLIAVSEFANYPEQAKKLPRVGNYMSLQLEQIIAKKPDIIFAWRSGSPQADLDKLAALGFNIAYSNPKTFADIAKDTRLIGKLTGHAKQAEQLALTFEAKLHKIQQQYQGKSPIVGFYELWHQPLTSIAKNAWPQQHLNICGVTNPFKSLNIDYPQISEEQLISQKLQLIIQPISANQKDKKGYNWLRWPQLEAVKFKQIIHPDADMMHRQTLRAVDELAKFCQQVDKVRHFYHSLKAKP